MRRKSFADYVHRFVYLFGVVSLTITVLIAMFVGLCMIEKETQRNGLNEGVVKDKSHNERDYWYSTFTIGDYSITKRNDGKDYYFVTVANGDKVDYWTVTEEQWNRLAVGQYVRR